MRTSSQLLAAAAAAAVGRREGGAVPRLLVAPRWHGDRDMEKRGKRRKRGRHDDSTQEDRDRRRGSAAAAAAEHATGSSISRSSIFFPTILVRPFPGASLYDSFLTSIARFASDANVVGAPPPPPAIPSPHPAHHTSCTYLAAAGEFLDLQNDVSVSWFVALRPPVGTLSQSPVSIRRRRRRRSIAVRRWH